MTTQLETGKLHLSWPGSRLSRGKGRNKGNGPCPQLLLFFSIEKHTGIRDGARGLGKLLEQARFLADYIFLILRKDKV